MPYKLAIASGKGGTGKTSISANLFHQFKQAGREVHLVDCDVEEPNALLFQHAACLESEKGIEQLIPAIDTDRCTFCRKCAEYCEYNAIVVIPPVKFAQVNASLCHSCGACLVACTYGAISERPEPIGAVHHYKLGQLAHLTEGRLRIGSAMQTLLIRELKKAISPLGEVILYDAPPGTSCPVVETIADADYVILVTEPTRFGVNDLKLMVALVRKLNLPFGVVINKKGLGGSEVYSYLEKEHIDLLAEIPFSREFASGYARGNFLETLPVEVAGGYAGLLEVVQHKIKEHEGDHRTQR